MSDDPRITNLHQQAEDTRLAMQQNQKSLEAAHKSGNLAEWGRVRKEGKALERRMGRIEHELRSLGQFMTHPSNKTLPLGMRLYITEQFVALSAHHRVVPPHVAVTKIESNLVGHNFSNVILLTDDLIGAWDVSPEETKTPIRFIIAHEFRHYLTYAKRIPLVSRIPEARHEESERIADEFATEWTGVTADKARTTWRDLFARAAKAK